MREIYSTYGESFIFISELFTSSYILNLKSIKLENGNTVKFAQQVCSAQSWSGIWLALCQDIPLFPTSHVPVHWVHTMKEKSTLTSGNKTKEVYLDWKFATAFHFQFFSAHLLIAQLSCCLSRSVRRSSELSPLTPDLIGWFDCKTYMARPVLKSIISSMLSLDISMNSKWPIYPHFVCRSCPTVFTYFPRSKVNPECEDHLYLMKHSETATFCRKILRFRGFLRCGFVVNNLKSLSSDWPIYGGVSLPLSAKTMHNWLLFAGVFHEL